MYAVFGISFCSGVNSNTVDKQQHHGIVMPSGALSLTGVKNPWDRQRQLGQKYHLPVVAI